MTLNGLQLIRFIFDRMDEGPDPDNFIRLSRENRPRHLLTYEKRIEKFVSKDRVSTACYCLKYLHNPADVLIPWYLHNISLLFYFNYQRPGARLFELY